MKKMYLVVALCALLVGCTGINKLFNNVAPNQVNAETNQEIVGTHTLTPVAQNIVTDAGAAGAAAGFPFVPVIVAGILGLVNAFQKWQNGKLNDALVSTVQTIETASTDPSLAPAIATLKNKLATSHQLVGVQPLINDILASIKMLPTTTPVK